MSVILGHLGVLLALLGGTSSYHGHAVTLSTLSALPVPMLRQVYKMAFSRGRSCKNGPMTMLTSCCYGLFSSRGLLGSSWGHPRHSLAILGLSGAHLGPSWAHLGPSWAHLGPSWGLRGGLKMVILCGRSFKNGDFAWEVLQKWQDGDVSSTC